jgi:hypothetical protein
MSVSLNLVTTSAMSDSKTVGVVSPKFVPVMCRDRSASSAATRVMIGGGRTS